MKSQKLNILLRPNKELRKNRFNKKRQKINPKKNQDRKQRKKRR